MALILFYSLFFNPMHSVFDKVKTFSGELIYKVTKVDSGSNPLQPRIMRMRKLRSLSCQSSLLKIVNFSAQNGFQECFISQNNKSILLLNINKKGYAIRMKQDESIMNDKFTLRKMGLKNIGGLKSKKIILHPEIKNELTSSYSKNCT